MVKEVNPSYIIVGFLLILGVNGYEINKIFCRIGIMWTLVSYLFEVSRRVLSIASIAHFPTRSQQYERIERFPNGRLWLM
jgi:hypothetical protein